MQSASITVCIDGLTAHLAVKGRGTFENSEDIRVFSINAIEAGIPCVEFDMGQCTGMDSTFMGILTMISRTAMMNTSKIKLSNVNEANRKNLYSLGLKQLFEFTETSTQPMSLEEIKTQTLDRDTKQKNILEAHEALIDAHDDNKPIFQDIVTFLKENNS